MPASNDPLNTRQHKRSEAQLQAQLIIDDAIREQLAFSPSSGALDSHCIRGTVADISQGGLGLASSQFLPKQCRARIRVEREFGTTSEAATVLEENVLVRRIEMLDHGPTYLIGMSFEKCDEAAQHRINAAIAALADHSGSAAPDEAEGDDA